MERAVKTRTAVTANADVPLAPNATNFRLRATVRTWVEEMGRLRIPRGTGSLADYEHVKRRLSVWLRNLNEAGIEAPSYEACIREIADWVGV